MGNNNNNGNNMNTIMFTPMNGRRSLFKRSQGCSYDPLNLVVIEGIRYFIYSPLNTTEYLSRIKDDTVKMVMKYVIEGAKKLRNEK